MRAHVFALVPPILLVLAVASPRAAGASPLASPNLAPYMWPGWSRPLVVRNAPDATFGSVPEPSILDGNVADTYWTMGGWNASDQPTGVGFQAWLHVDGVWMGAWGWGPIGPWGGYWSPNTGPLTVRGGRHVVGVEHDALWEVPETNEADNTWGHQWVWSPLDVTDSPVALRPEPPASAAGLGSVVDGSPVFFNCDGLRFVTTGWWNAVTLRAVDATEDYDLRLHLPSPGPASGFDSHVAWSNRTLGLEAVLVNRNTVALSNWDVGVLDFGGLHDYAYQHVKSTYVGFGPTNTGELAAGESMDLWEVYLGPGDIGPVSFVVQITDPNPGATPLKLRWLDVSFTTGALSDLPGTAVSDANGLARIDASVSTSGYHCLMVYREVEAGLALLHYTVRIHRTPPDFAPYWASGWYAPLVPRGTPDGTPSSVPAPTTLPGDKPQTCLNHAVINQGPTGANMLDVMTYLDGMGLVGLTFANYFGPGGVGLANIGFGETVPGGRHVLSAVLDYDLVHEEIWETNNVYGAQWVWSPTQLYRANGYFRDGVPERTGGWGHVASGPLYWDCDAVRMPDPEPNNGWWSAIALMPLDLATDYDPRLHERSTGAQDGFTSPLVQSFYGAGQCDYVLANYNLTSFRAFDAGIVKYGPSAGEYLVETVESQFISNYPVGLQGPFWLGAYRVLNLHEVMLWPGLWEVDVVPDAGWEAVDWGLTVHPCDVAYQQRGTSLPGGQAWLAGSGQGEHAIVQVVIPGYYCVGVWKATSNDLSKWGAYQLQFVHQQGSTDVPASAPAATALRGAFPNPLRVSTSVRFALAREQQVQLEVFDARGARVRTLCRGRLGPGDHALEWHGEDDDGRATSPGLYLIRFRSGGIEDQRKVVKLE